MSKITTIIFLFLSLSLYSQDHFLVEFEKFSPPIQDMIRGFEGQQAMQFLAPDINGTEQFLGNYKGKKVVIWFWSKDDALCLNQIDVLNDLQSRFADELSIVSFANESKAELLEFIQIYPVDFPILYNGSMLGEAAYGGDLGLGRMFLLDEKGIIKDVLPRELFEQGVNAYQAIESVITKI